MTGQRSHECLEAGHVVQFREGAVCVRPLENTSCLILPRIGAGKRDDIETRCACKPLDKLDTGDLPPCVDERVSFMAPFELSRTMRHPYAENNAETYGHFAPARFVQLPHSAACVPFRWMLRGEVDGDPKNNEPGLAERLQLGWVPDREPGLKFDTAWVQQRDNQLAVLDTFFGALRQEESLCFFLCQAYAALGAVAPRNCWRRPRAVGGTCH